MKTGLIGETVSGTLEIFRDEKTQAGVLSYGVTYSRSPGKLSDKETGNFRGNHAVLSVRKSTLDSGGWLQRTTGVYHYFVDGVYTSSRIDTPTNSFSKILKDFHIPRRMRESLQKTKDPLINMVLGKYLK